MCSVGVLVLVCEHIYVLTMKSQQLHLNQIALSYSGTKHPLDQVMLYN